MVSSLSAYASRRSHLYPAFILFPHSFRNNGISMCPMTPLPIYALTNGLAATFKSWTISLCQGKQASDVARHLKCGLKWRKNAMCVLILIMWWLMNVADTSHWANSDSANLMTRLSMLWKLHVLMTRRPQWRNKTR